MSYNTVVVASNTSPLVALDPLLQAAGFTLVDSGVTFLLGGTAGQNATVNVYKSPAASNSANQDWYLVIGSVVVTTTRFLAFSVCEGWDATAHQATKYVPNTNNVVPAADFSIGTTPASLASAFIGINNGWTDASGFTFTINITIDRLIILAVQSFYVGLMDRAYPTTVDPVNPVGWVNLVPNGASTANNGGCTRCPGAVTATAYNWRVQVSNNTFGRPFTPFTLADSVTGKPFLSPLAICESRFPTSSMRALLKDMRINQTTTSTGSDTLTETMADGSTRSYAAVNTGGMFMPTF